MEVDGSEPNGGANGPQDAKDKKPEVLPMPEKPMPERKTPPPVRPKTNQIPPEVNVENENEQQALATKNYIDMLKSRNAGPPRRRSEKFKRPPQPEATNGFSDGIPGNPTEVEEPTPDQEQTKVETTTPVQEPTEVKEPTPVHEPTQVEKPTQVPEPTPVHGPITVKEPTAVQEPVPVQEPIEVIRPTESQEPVVNGLNPPQEIRRNSSVGPATAPAEPEFFSVLRHLRHVESQNELKKTSEKDAVPSSPPLLKPVSRNDAVTSSSGDADVDEAATSPRVNRPGDTQPVDTTPSFMKEFERVKRRRSSRDTGQPPSLTAGRTAGELHGRGADQSPSPATPAVSIKAPGGDAADQTTPNPATPAVSIEAPGGVAADQTTPNPATPTVSIKAPGGDAVDQSPNPATPTVSIEAPGGDAADQTTPNPVTPTVSIKADADQPAAVDSEVRTRDADQLPHPTAPAINGEVHTDKPMNPTVPVADTEVDGDQPSEVPEFVRLASRMKKRREQSFRYA